MRDMRAVFPAVLALLGVVGAATCVAAETGGDAMAWLKKIAAASRQINYAGTFVYQHGRKMETSRIAHMADANGEHERLETLEGPPREIIRNNENVTCYLPDSKTIIIEKRTLRQFPAMLPEQLSGIAENYAVTKGQQERVAGYDCQVIVLDPRDNLRYGHNFCAELASGLPLRARTVNEKGEVVDMFVFTQLAIGSGVNKDLLKSRFAGQSSSWHVERAVMVQRESGTEVVWVIKNPLVGFKKLTEMKRSIAGHSNQVAQVVYSDGLAALSVFVEPLPKSPPVAGASYQGAVNMYVRPLSDQMVTVVGETPARTVRQMAESITLKDR
jgi:sigma-E factor negative regulatory protein RseB